MRKIAVSKCRNLKSISPNKVLWKIKAAAHQYIGEWTPQYKFKNLSLAY